LWLLRGLTICGALFTVYFILNDTALRSGRAHIEANLEPGAISGYLIASHVTPHLGAASGLRDGDAIDFVRAGWIARSQILTPYGGISIAVPIERAGRSIVLSIPTALDRASFTGYSIALGDLWMLAFAYFLGTRKPEDSDVRALCYVLIAYAVGSCWLNVAFPNPALNALSPIFAYPLLVLSATIFALFALRFIAPSLLVRVARWVIWSLFAVTVLVATVVVVGTFAGSPDPYKIMASWGLFTNDLHYLLPRTAALLCGVLAIASSHGEPRRRIAWATVSVAFLYATTIVTQILVITGFARPDPGNPFIALGIFLVPAGLTYAVLSRRIIDTGFILNRAAVFSGVSLVLVGTFVLVEWMLSGWLTSAGRTTNILVTACLALVLGFSMRFVHAHVDRAVDTVFFRKRHQDEKAIRSFSEEAPYITDSGTLIDRCKAVLEQHSNASSVQILLDDRRGHYGGIDENDAGIVRLRASRQTVDLHEVDTALSGDLAFPMMARGRLVGVIVLGARRSGESYAPDEASAIAQLAHSVGAALDVHSNRSGDGDGLGERIAAMETTIVTGLETTNKQLRELLRLTRDSLTKAREKS
jgi:hypothetical protein